MNKNRTAILSERNALSLATCLMLFQLNLLNVAFGDQSLTSHLNERDTLVAADSSEHMQAEIGRSFVLFSICMFNE